MYSFVGKKSIYKNHTGHIFNLVCWWKAVRDVCSITVGVLSNQAGRPRIRGAQRRRVRSTTYRTTPNPSPHGGPAHPRRKVKLSETTLLCPR